MPSPRVTHSFCCFTRRFLPLAALLLSAAAFSHPASGAERYRFTYRGLDSGEQAVQQADFHLDVQVTMEQSGKQIDSSKQQVRRSQECRITVLETAIRGGQQVKKKVRLTFDGAHQSAVIDDAQREAALPVEGKSYVAELVGEEVVITYPDGGAPPPAEQQIVAATTQALGQPNPIAHFFHGRTIALGETLKMPPELAKDLLGFSGKLDNASAFQIKLIDVRPYGGAQCALFETRLSSKMPKDNRFAMEMTGRLLMQIDTCRAVWIELTGPVEVAETRGPAGGEFTVRTKGQVKMALQAEYPARR